MWASLTFYLLLNTFGSIRGVSTRDTSSQRVHEGLTSYTMVPPRKRGHLLGRMVTTQSTGELGSSRR